MKREILFRGKRIDNSEWVYGDFLKSYCVYVGYEASSAIYDGKRFYEVITETIGQFTGLTDKNGKEIFEGDIYNMGDKNILYVVVWRDCGLIGKQLGSTSYAGVEYWKEKIEIIGNIHDNPELLK